MVSQKPTPSFRSVPAKLPGVSTSSPGRPRLQELPFHIQEAIWRSVILDLEPQTLFLELDELKDVPRKPYHDTVTALYKHLESYLDSANPTVRLANIEDTNSMISRRTLRISTRMVRFFGSLCANSRRATIEAFPHTVGLGFAKRSNKKEDASLRNSILRFSGAKDLCVISAAQWEQQVHFLRNKHTIAPSVGFIKNWGLDLETLWNDRVLQIVHARQKADPLDTWQHLERHTPLYIAMLPLWPLEYNFPGGRLDSRQYDWKGSCGCSASGARQADSDWNPSAWEPPSPTVEVPGVQRGWELPCREVCKREPLPTFICSLPNIRTLVLVATDDPITLPAGVDVGSGFSSSEGYSPVRAGNEMYVRRELDRGNPDFLPSVLNSIRKHWRLGFPYQERIPNARIELMRRVTVKETGHEPTPTTTRDTDIPFIFGPVKTPGWLRPNLGWGKHNSRRRQNRRGKRFEWSLERAQKRLRE